MKKTKRWTPWTKEVVKNLKTLYPNKDTREVAAALGMSYEAVKKYASRHGICKSPRYLRSIGRK